MRFPEWRFGDHLGRHDLRRSLPPLIDDADGGVYTVETPPAGVGLYDDKFIPGLSQLADASCIGTDASHHRPDIPERCRYQDRGRSLVLSTLTADELP